MTPTEIADFLDQVRAARHRLTREEVSPESAAADAIAGAARERGNGAIAERVVILTDLWTLVGAEQLGAIATLIRSQAASFGLFPLVRSIFEHSAATVWVLDPNIGHEMRCARAALAVDRSNLELVTAASHLGGKGNPVHKARLEVMRAHRKQLLTDFPDDTESANGAPSRVAGEVPLSPTNLVRHQAELAHFDPTEWEGIYDYLCATANHPTLAAFEHFNDLDGNHVRPEITADMLDRLVRVVLASYMMALQGYAGYCGWDASEVKRLREQSEQLFPDPPDATPHAVAVVAEPQV